MRRHRRSRSVVPDAPAQPRHGRPGAPWRTLLLAVLLAFSWQSFVAQTHQHLDLGGIAPASTQLAATDARDPARKAPADQPAGCPICREIAHAGAYLLPTPATIGAPAPVLAWFSGQALTRLSLARHPHGWQSRAPPLHLQA